MSEIRKAMHSTLSDGEEIDLRELVRNLWEMRYLILLVSFCGILVGAIYAFVIVTPKYESSALLLPTQASSTDQLGAAAAIFGKKSTGSADVDLYQSLLTSRTVIHKLLNAPVFNKSDTGGNKIEPLYRILKVDTNNAGNLDAAVTSLAKSIIVDSKESGAGGILEIKFSAEYPWLAQAIGNSVLEIGQEELREVRIERSAVILARLDIAVEQAKAQWDSSARSTTWYRDRNRSIVLPEQFLQLTRLQMEQEVEQQKYLLARKEYESQLLERVKAAPPMMILDPANLPVHKSGPRRAALIAAWFVSSFILGCVGVLIWKAWAFNLKAAKPHE